MTFKPRIFNLLNKHLKQGICKLTSYSDLIAREEHGISAVLRVLSMFTSRVYHPRMERHPEVLAERRIPDSINRQISALT